MLAGPARAAEVDPYLPDDTEVLVTVNVRQVLDSPLVKKSTLEKLREALKDIDMAEDVLKDLGFDPFKDLDRVTAFIRAVRGNDRSGRMPPIA